MSGSWPLEILHDNCLSPKYVAILGALDLGEVTHLREHFVPNTDDEVWIPAIGSHGWALISKDRAQMSLPHQRAALQKAGVVSIYLAKAFDHHKLVEHAWRMVRFWPAICEAAHGARPGSSHLVTINGKVVPYGK